MNEPAIDKNNVPEPRIDWDKLMNRYIKAQADLKEERTKNKRLKKALAYANKKMGNWLVRDTLRRISAGYEGCSRCGGDGYEPGHRIPMVCTKCQGTGLVEPQKTTSPLNMADGTA